MGKNIDSYTFLDLFAGGGGVSEGFIRAGYTPVAHVEKNRAACYTLKTRMAYHYLKRNNKLSQYIDYIKGITSRKEFYKSVPEEIIHSVINAEINKENITRIFKQIYQRLAGKRLDLIIGGPPCQAYSLVGRSRSTKKMKGDARNYLYLWYIKFLERYKPNYFVFENVVGLLSAKSEEGNSYFEEMTKLFTQAGYKTQYKILDASHYGVPQKRKRIILVGKRGIHNFIYPDPKPLNIEIQVNEALDDLISLKAGRGNPHSCELRECDNTYLVQAGITDNTIPVTMHWARPHIKRDLEIYKIAVRKWNKEKVRLNYNDLPEYLKTHKNRKAFTDRFKVVAGDSSFSHTVMAHIAKDGHYYIHPDMKQNRSLTPREAARLQTFPDNYYFESTSGKPQRSPAYVQIGNAVPVLLAQAIAEKLKKVWYE